MAFQPWPVSWSTSAPASSNASTTSVCPYTAASCRALHPSGSAAFTSAPRHSSSFTVSTWPAQAAHRSAVLPESSRIDVACTEFLESFGSMPDARAFSLSSIWSIPYKCLNTMLASEEASIDCDSRSAPPSTKVLHIPVSPFFAASHSSEFNFFCGRPPKHEKSHMPPAPLPSRSDPAPASCPPPSWRAARCSAIEGGPNPSEEGGRGRLPEVAQSTLRRRDTSRVTKQNPRAILR
mmetsp:Transcript_47742/g.115981  ORF Transcript_47742/g.115981 Transcript_47742/m.115981 type:complete len:236 (+) Transcript_47742:350-1057(+)